jgi:hypothetical protein
MSLDATTKELIEAALVLRDYCGPVGNHDCPWNRLHEKADAYRRAHPPGVPADPAPALTPEQEARVRVVADEVACSILKAHLSVSHKPILEKIAALESRRDPPELAELREAGEEWADQFGLDVVRDFPPKAKRLYRAIRAESAARRAGKETS